MTGVGRSKKAANVQRKTEKKKKKPITGKSDCLEEKYEELRSGSRLLHIT